MAFYEISELLSNDKQTLVTVVRKKINNSFKLKELVSLKVKVGRSVSRLKELVERLVELIKHDTDIQQILRRLKNELRLDLVEKQKILSVINYYSKVKSDQEKNDLI